PRPRVDRAAFLLRGGHLLEVRARDAGLPATTDGQPVRIEVPMGLQPELAAPGALEFHGQSSGGGCDCQSGGGRAGGLVIAVLVGLALLLPHRRWARASSALAVTGLVIALAVLLGGCGGDAGGGDDDIDPSVVNPGPTGRWSSMAADGDRVVLAAYEQDFGDLVLAEITGEGRPEFRAIDGVPDVAPVLDPTGYRGGITEPGDDVGAWTSIALSGGRALIAYQDLGRRALRFAAEDGDRFVAHDVALPTDDLEEVGRYASLSLDAGGVPAIAFMTLRREPAPDDAEAPATVTTQLRWAQASSAAPAAATDWTVETIAEVSGEAPGFEDVPAGTGLFAGAARLPDGRPVIACYDRLAGDPLLAVRDGDGWAIDRLDAADADRGQWISMAVTDDGTVYAVYQDATDDRLLARTWTDGTLGALEVVDDGFRDGDRPHSVGGGARLVIDGDTPVVLYQDGTSSDLLWSARGSDGWAGGDLFTGDIGYGFFNAVARSGDRLWVATYAYDQSHWPPGHTEVRRLDR
ncbi:MAG TPA: hypothetical protein VL172_02245, partial [Kofleriaceae bacterium]|nr:hypothetical protein [Kofleriaceae bacterium]